jgi:hypothetical protein
MVYDSLKKIFCLSFIKFYIFSNSKAHRKNHVIIFNIPNPWFTFFKIVTVDWQAEVASQFFYFYF